MIDLRVLRDLWSDGARDIFEELVLQCVRTIDQSARRLRPNPGDQGIDTFIGEFANTIKVWQAKYFVDDIKAAQQKQVRDSWSTLMSAKDITKVTDWTLCIPYIMDAAAEKWWQNWMKKQKNIYSHVNINLWYHSDFVAFYADSKLTPIFNCALNRGAHYSNKDDVLKALAGLRQEMTLHDLPNNQQFSTARFVRKLELAEVKEHAAARRAFYNFELLRNVVTQGGNQQEIEELNDLLLRVHALWDTEFQARTNDKQGRQFYAKVMKRIEGEHQKQLLTSLPAGIVHKKGSLHYCADLCEAGWTDNFRDVDKQAT